MGKSKRRRNEKKKEARKKADERKTAKKEMEKRKKAEHTNLTTSASLKPNFRDGIKCQIEPSQCNTEKVFNSEDERFEDIVRRMTDGYQKQIEPSILMRSDSKYLPKFENIDQWEKYNNLASRLNTLLEVYKCDYLRSCRKLQEHYDKDSVEYRILENAIKTQSLCKER